jgi:hypothetical protein
MASRTDRPRDGLKNEIPQRSEGAMVPPGNSAPWTLKQVQHDGN